MSFITIFFAVAAAVAAAYATLIKNQTALIVVVVVACAAILILPLGFSGDQATANVVWFLLMYVASYFIATIGARTYRDYREEQALVQPGGPADHSSGVPA